MTLFPPKSVIKIMTIFLIVPILLFAERSYAAKSVSLTATSSSVKVGENIQIEVKINTEGASINAVGFNINFSTETLEGLVPNQAGSVFPMCAKVTATRYDCGITGQDGFSGEGLVTTLIFKGRKVGDTTVSIENFEARFGPLGQQVTGFSAGSYEVKVTEAAPTSNTTGDDSGSTTTPSGQSSSSTTASSASSTTSSSSSSTSSTSTSTSSTSTSSTSTSSTPTTTTPETPPVTINIQEPPPPPSVPGDQSTPATTAPTTDTLSQVEGNIGSGPEEPLKTQSAEEITEKELVKGLFTANPANFGYLSTLLLLFLAAYLGTKLFFTEKRRHLELEYMIENQLSTLSALESKLDLADQKGEGHREKLLEEFEEAKAQIRTEANANSLQMKAKA